MLKLVLLCAVAAHARERSWVRRLQEVNLGTLGRKLQAAGGSARRRLTVAADSCDCVQRGWMPPLMYNVSDPPGTAAGRTLPGSCLSGLLADCQAGGELQGAPECDLAQLDVQIQGMRIITRFFPSSIFTKWLISASTQCQEVPVFTPDTIGAILEAPPQAPPLFSVETVSMFLTLYATSIGLPDTAHTVFLQQHISGPQWSAFTESDYQELGFSKGQAFSANVVFQDFLSGLSESGEYISTADGRVLIGPTKVYPQVILERLIDVQAPNYFEIEYYVNLGWEDRRIFTRCMGAFATDDPDPSDPCSYFWKPTVLLPEALLNDDEPALVQDFGFTTHVGTEQDPGGRAGQNMFLGHKYSIGYVQVPPFGHANWVMPPTPAHASRWPPLRYPPTQTQTGLPRPPPRCTFLPAHP